MRKTLIGILAIGIAPFVALLGAYLTPVQAFHKPYAHTILACSSEAAIISAGDVLTVTNITYENVDPIACRPLANRISNTIYQFLTRVGDIRPDFEGDWFGAYRFTDESEDWTEWLLIYMPQGQETLY